MENNNVPRIPDFTVLRRIGGGSYGVVWIARSLTGIYRAVKVVERARFADARPFLRELDGITRFQQTVGNQPRQLALMHVGRDDDQGIFYYVMELADDVDASTDIDPARYTPLTLKALRDRRHRLPATECVRLGIELARALAGLHAAGLIHRDVKPSNIIFVNGVPKLADVGLVSSSDHTLTSLGTPGYAPPEGAGTMEADVYGLGKILYELATGCATTEFPRLPAEVAESADAALLLELNEVLLRACHPDPRERYPTAQTMLDDLLLIEAGKSVKELVRTKRRLRVLARASGIAALIALAAFGMLGWKYYLAAKRLAEQESAARQQAERDERLARYSADMQLAELALVDDDYGLARTALRRQLPGDGRADLRNVEWSILWSDTAGVQSSMLGRVGEPALRALALAPRGSHAASLAGDGRIFLWDIRGTPAARREIPGVSLGGFSSDGRFFYAGRSDRSIEVFDSDNGQPVGRLGALGRILAFGEKGRWIVVGAIEERGARLRVWDAEQNREAGSWYSGPGPGESTRQLTTAALRADGSMAASAYYDVTDQGRVYSLVVWDTASGTESYRRSLSAPARALAFDATGSRLAIARSDGIADIWDVGTDRMQTSVNVGRGWVTAVSFDSTAGTLGAAGSDGGVVWWNPQTDETNVLRGHEGSVTALRWSDDGTTLWSAGDDGTLRRWTKPDAIRSEQRFWSGASGDLLLTSRGDRGVITSADGTLSLVQLPGFKVERTFPTVFQPLAWLEEPDRLLVQAADGSIADLSIPTGELKLLASLPAPRGDLLVLNSSADGRFVVGGLSDGRLALWRKGDPQFQLIGAPTQSSVRAVAVDDEGDEVLSGHRDGSVWRSTAATGTRLQVPMSSSAPVTCLIVFPGRGLAAVARENGEITIVDLQTNRVAAELKAHAKPVNALVVSPDGSRLLSGDSSGYIVTWAVSEWRSVAALLAFPKAPAGSYPGLYRVRFAADGSRLAVLSEEGRVRQWPLTRSELK